MLMQVAIIKLSGLQTYTRHGGKRKTCLEGEGFQKEEGGGGASMRLTMAGFKKRKCFEN